MIVSVLQNVICKILTRRPSQNFLPGVLCVTQGHRITYFYVPQGHLWVPQGHLWMESSRLRCFIHRLISPMHQTCITLMQV